MRKSWIVTALATVALFCGFTACKEGDDSQSSSESSVGVNVESLHWGNPVEELNVTVEQAAALDFSQYYTLAIEGKTQTVTVDKSAFVNVAAGQSYVIKYAYGEKKAELTVNVYGTPTVTVAEESKTTLNLTWENRTALASGVTAKDSFGNELTVSTKLVNTDADSKKAYGTFTATHTATDKAGNKQTYTRTVVIAQKQFAAIAAKATDLAHPECLVDGIADMTPLSGAIGGVALGASDWVIGNGYFMLTAATIARAGVGEHTVEVAFDGAETSFTLTVTDNQEPKYTVDESAFKGTIYAGEELTLPEAVKDRYSYQDIEVSYKLNDNGIDNLTVTPIKGKNKFEVVYSRGESKTYEFTAVERSRATVDAATYAAGYELEWTVSPNPDFVRLGEATDEKPLNPASGDLSYFIYFGAGEEDMKSGYSIITRSNSQFSIGGLSPKKETTVDNMYKFLGGSIFNATTGSLSMWSPFLFNPYSVGRNYLDGNDTLRFKLRAVSEGEKTTVSLYLKHKLADYWDMLFSIQGFDKIAGVTYAGISYGGEQGSAYINGFTVQALGAAPRERVLNTTKLVTDASKKIEMTYTLGTVDDTYVNGGWNYLFYNETNQGHLESTGGSYICKYYIGLNGQMKTDTSDEYTPTWSGATWVPSNVTNGGATATITADNYIVNKAFERATVNFNEAPLKSYVIDNKVKFKWTFENVTVSDKTTLKVSCAFMNASGTYDELITVTGLAPMLDNTYVGLYYQNMGCYEKSYITDFTVTEKE